jgi:hypothetical protein
MPPAGDPLTAEQIQAIDHGTDQRAENKRPASSQVGREVPFVAEGDVSRRAALASQVDAGSILPPRKNSGERVDRSVVHGYADLK